MQTQLRRVTAAESVSSQYAFLQDREKVNVVWKEKDLKDAAFTKVYRCLDTLWERVIQELDDCWRFKRDSSPGI